MESDILELISNERSYRLVFYKILKFCEVPRLYSEIEAEVVSLPEMKTAIHSPDILVQWLEKAGAIQKTVEEKEKKETWQITDAGKKVEQIESPEKRLIELINKELVYREVYMQILKFCQEPRTRVEIEDLLKGNPVLEKPYVAPGFFVQNLEETGGIEWVNNRWQTTEVAKALL